MQPIGVLGGTFDPVHCGHLRLALEVREQLGLRRVHLVAARVPPHRDAPRADAATRMRMLAAAVRDTQELVADERELRRDGASYTVDTLAAFREEAPERPLCLILGMDAFCGLASWHRWQELCELAHLAVARRPGSEPPAQGEVAALLEARRSTDTALLQREPAGAVFLCDVPPLAISASRIRELLARGRSVRFLLPDETLDIITKDGIYLDSR